MKSKAEIIKEVKIDLDHSIYWENQPRNIDERDERERIREMLNIEIESKFTQLKSHLGGLCRFVAQQSSSL